MCGICCHIVFQSFQGKERLSNVVNLSADCILTSMLNARGPDDESSFSTELHQLVKAYFMGCTLYQQGPEYVKQPYVDDFQNVLLWNGEIYNSTEKVKSDTFILAEKLSSCQKDSEVCKVMSQIKGPWAFIYWQEKSKSLWFGRDRLGRRSLLWNIQEVEKDVISDLILTSVAAHCSCSQHGIGESMVHEVPAEGLFCIRFDEKNYNNSNLKIDRYSWLDHQTIQNSTNLQTFDAVIQEMEKFSIHINDKLNISPPVNCILNNELPITEIDSTKYEKCSHDFIFADLLKDSMFDFYVKQFSEKFGQAVKLRTNHQQFQCKNCFSDKKMKCSHANIAILFSGGIDCAVIAAYADKYTQPNIPIDLINVAFCQKDKCSIPSKHKEKNREVEDKTSSSEKSDDGTYSVPDRITGYESLKELKLIFPHRTWNFIELSFVVLKHHFNFNYGG
ncbi:Asparagine synthetase domain-containing protein 1 [Nymphon striatum]|nr:Asparagine synthetase domain-containing protein 1 [Nymphon striatum]